jgi:hypothetical protein
MEMIMRTAIRGVALIALISMTAPVHAMTDAECVAEFTKADANKDGKLTGSELDRYAAAMRIAGSKSPASALARTEFIDSCKAGTFVVRKVEAGAPFAGANSFTEQQAKDRAVWFGLKSITGLKKDAKGIWRGTAVDGAEKNVSFAVDYKGNVVVK